MIVVMRGPDQMIIQVGQYTADLLRSKSSGDTSWYVVIQPRFSRDIIGIDDYSCFVEARASAFQALEELNRRDAKGQTT
jgi:hypothetical protein